MGVHKDGSKTNKSPQDFKSSFKDLKKYQKLSSKYKKYIEENASGPVGGIGLKGFENLDIIKEIVFSSDSKSKVVDSNKVFYNGTALNNMLFLKKSNVPLEKLLDKNRVNKKFEKKYLKKILKDNFQDKSSATKDAFDIYNSSQKGKGIFPKGVLVNLKTISSKILPDAKGVDPESNSTIINNEQVQDSIEQDLNIKEDSLKKTDKMDVNYSLEKVIANSINDVKNILVNGDDGLIDQIHVILEESNKLSIEYDHILTDIKSSMLELNNDLKNLSKALPNKDSKKTIIGDNLDIIKSLYEIRSHDDIQSNVKKAAESKRNVLDKVLEFKNDLEDKRQVKEQRLQVLESSNPTKGDNRLLGALKALFSPEAIRKRSLEREIASFDKILDNLPDIEKLFSPASVKMQKHYNSLEKVVGKMEGQQRQYDSAVKEAQDKISLIHENLTKDLKNELEGINSSIDEIVQESSIKTKTTKGACRDLEQTDKLSVASKAQEQIHTIDHETKIDIALKPELEEVIKLECIKGAFSQDCVNSVENLSEQNSLPGKVPDNVPGRSPDIEMSQSR